MLSTHRQDAIGPPPSLATTTHPRLPSCRQCRHRKVKCDSRRPKCGTCVKHSAVCDFIDSTTGQTFTREYISHLEKEEEDLKILLRQTEPEIERPHANVISPDQILADAAKKTDGMTPGRFEAGGISFLKLLFTDPAWRQRNVDLLQKFAQKPHVIEIKLSPNPLPDQSDAAFLVERYLAGSHVQNPFLLRRDVEMIFQRIYSVPPSEAPHSKHDLFSIFMLFAVGSIIPYRRDQHGRHPFGYYLAALEFFDQNFLGAGLRGIQDLLLIARFGIYHHIGTSIWEIAQICIRMCIEQGLHRKSSPGIDCIQEQLQRRLFWHCYVIDRYSSTTLGRPFAIADQEITVPFPVGVDDDALYSFNGPLDEVQAAQDSNEISVFICYVGLRQITSHMHEFFNRASKPSSSDTSPLRVNGQIHVKLHKFLEDLSMWRNSAPNYTEPTCLYHLPEWRDFMYERYRLLLLRAAIDAAPKHNGLPSKELIEMMSDTATDLIFLYSDMFEKGHITYTRSYFQMLFTGGLSLMFSIAAMGHFEEFKLQDRPTEALRICERILVQMSLQLQDSTYYTAIFEALHRETIRGSSLVYQQFLTSSVPTRLGSPSTLESSQPQYLRDISHSNAPFTVPHAEQPGQKSLQELEEPQSHAAFAQNMQVQDIGINNSNPYAPAFQSFDEYNSGAAVFPPGDNAMLHWGGFSDDWLSMEAGLGEYAYGDPNSNWGIWDQLHLNMNGYQV